MPWDESDLDLQKEFADLSELEQKLNILQRKIREQQIGINNLKMVGTSKTNKNRETTITYSFPNNYAGNEMNKNNRDSQKSALIINIKKLKNEINVMLKN